MQLPMIGHPVHTRSLTLAVTLAADGRWSIRADIIDLRKSSFVPLLSDLQPAGIIHQMTIEAVVDPSRRRLESLETAQPFVAIEPSEKSGGECCRDPSSRLQALVGETLDAAFPKRLSAVFGGPRGCSHLLTLFHLMVSGTLRALDLEAAGTDDRAAARLPGERLFRRAAFVDGCEIDGDTIGVGIQIADFLTRPVSAVEHPLDSLVLQSDARVYAVVARRDLALLELHAATRNRTAADLLSAAWTDRDLEVAPLLGAPVMGGLGRRILDLIDDANGRSLLADCLLQLAPGFVQITAALLEPVFARTSELHIAARTDGPSAVNLGGMTDSCYMWRAGGPTAALRATFGSSDDGG